MLYVTKSNTFRSFITKIFTKNKLSAMIIKYFKSLICKAMINNKQTKKKRNKTY